jgi:hypothetical protein
MTNKQVGYTALPAVTGYFLLQVDLYWPQSWILRNDLEYHSVIGKPYKNCHDCCMLKYENHNPLGNRKFLYHLASD